MSRRVILILFISILLLGSSFWKPASFSNSAAVDRLYGQWLKELDTELNKLHAAISNRSPIKTIRRQFKQTRLSYKHAAILIDYFHPRETRLINGAVLARTEDDSPEAIIQPSGFQVIEEIIFSDWNKNGAAKTINEIELIKKVVTSFINQPNRSFKFKDANVIDAIRSAVIRITTLGLTGFDSPIALNSLPEIAASLDAIDRLLSIYSDAGILTDAEFLKNELQDAKRFLTSHRSFEKFDQLSFIQYYAKPLYVQLIKSSGGASFQMPEGRQPLTIDTNFLSHKMFSLDFFSPSARFQQTPDRIALGKKLFNDPILSSTNDRSCASCHQAEKAFTDGMKTAQTLDKRSYLLRNTPTLLNSVYQTRQFYDSRAALLEHQLNAVVHNEQEMQGSLTKSVDDLQRNTEYKNFFLRAYPQENPAISEYTIANAVSSYVRSLIAFDSRFDHYLAGATGSLTKDEKKGFNLFMGKAKCATCHFLPLFNGLVPPEFIETESEVIAVPAMPGKKSPTLDTDIGKYGHSRSVLHKYAFKTPTLRNIELTPPYMHNGVFNSLEEVMEFYNNGGGAGLGIAPETQTLPRDKLFLSKKEIKQVISFLHALTDTSFNQYKLRH
ncbi:MAG: cytochrome-c peroxidase [Chitinophagaceae bacterium]|nr:cytochrome-c peroxidase [Chitinophagaceae bacterium]